LRKQALGKVFIRVAFAAGVQALGSAGERVSWPVVWVRVEKNDFVAFENSTLFQKSHFFAIESQCSIDESQCWHVKEWAHIKERRVNQSISSRLHIKLKCCFSKFEFSPEALPVPIVTPSPQSSCINNVFLDAPKKSPC
jgi:hypothetical protein